MNRAKHLTLKIFSLIVLTDLIESSSQFFLKKGTINFPSMSLSNLSEYILFIKSMINSHFIWLGFLMITINFFLWMVVLNKVDLSVAFPAGSASFLFVPIAAIFFLGEHIGILRWLGMILIIGGVILISKSSYDS
ncbi:MAG: EamA family transporter [Candidatus Omnitrophota bacterium]